MTPRGNQRSPGDPEELRAQSDEELIAGILSGSHDAITVLFDRYSRLIFRVAERILRDSSEAEEVLQTVFMDVFRTAAKFDPARGSVRIWLLQHAYFTSLSRRRQLTARHFYTSEEIGSIVSEIVRHNPRTAPDSQAGGLREAGPGLPPVAASGHLGGKQVDAVGCRRDEKWSSATLRLRAAYEGMVVPDDSRRSTMMRCTTSGRVDRSDCRPHKLAR